MSICPNWNWREAQTQLANVKCIAFPLLAFLFRGAVVNWKESLSNQDGNTKENVTLKMISKYFKLVRDSFNSSNLSNVAEQSGSWLCKDDVTVQVEKENSLSCVNILHKTLNLVISRCCFAEDSKEMYRTCRVIVLLIKPFVFWRSHQPSPSCLLTQSQTVTIYPKKIRIGVKSRPSKAVARLASPWEAIWPSRKTGKCLRF